MRVCAYIDGFNFYHRLNDLQHATGENLKWLDYPTLIQRIFTDDPQLARFQPIDLQVHFFTARPVYKSLEVQQRHGTYMEALKSTGVTVFEGFFLTIDDPDNQRIVVREKQSDVALAVTIYRHGVQNRYDLAVLLSGDSDFAPALKAIREDCLDKQLLLMTPPSARKCGELMKWTTLARRKTHASLLCLCQLPNQLQAFGSTITNPYL